MSLHSLHVVQTSLQSLPLAMAVTSSLVHTVKSLPGATAKAAATEMTSAAPDVAAPVTPARPIPLRVVNRGYDHSGLNE